MGDEAGEEEREEKGAVVRASFLLCDNLRTCSFRTGLFVIYKAICYD